MENKTKSFISIVVFTLALCTYVLTCPAIAILLPNMPSFADRLQTQEDARIKFFSLVLMIVSLCFFVKFTVQKEKVLLWNCLIVLFFPALMLIISNQAFKRTILESEAIILRSAIVEDKRLYARRRGRGTPRIDFYFYRNGERVARERVTISREWFHQVNIGDTILIMQTINDWQGVRIFSINPTNEEKIKGLGGFEMGRSRLERNED